MPSFFEISPQVPEKIFEVFFTIYGYGGHFGHVTWIIHIYIGYAILYMLYIKFGFAWPCGFREEDV